jgi:hypothetical protein
MGDGLTHFTEFAVGSDPNQASEAPLNPVGGTTGSELMVAFVRSRKHRMEASLRCTRPARTAFPAHEESKALHTSHHPL